jgi:uncharacterized membrane protein YkoI
MLKPSLAAALFLTLAASGCASHHSSDAKEVPVTMTELPAAVRATLERESAGGKVTEIERETKNGKTTYSADMTVAGVEWDIAIAEDGSVISKEKEHASAK